MYAFTFRKNHLMFGWSCFHWFVFLYKLSVVEGSNLYFYRLTDHHLAFLSFWKRKNSRLSQKVKDTCKTCTIVLFMCLVLTVFFSPEILPFSVKACLTSVALAAGSHNTSKCKFCILINYVAAARKVFPSVWH